MNIRFTEYEDDRARRENRDGIERIGQVWGPGPIQGTQWVTPEDGSSLAVVVHRAAGVKGLRSWYALRTEAA
jgi:hypothetical protein